MQDLLFSLMPNPILFAITGKLSAGKKYCEASQRMYPQTAFSQSLMRLKLDAKYF